MSSGEIFAEAKVLQQGYKIAFTEGEIKDSNGNIIAKGTGIFKLIRDK
jgi:acyl-CoA thioesterase